MCVGGCGCVWGLCVSFSRMVDTSCVCVYVRKGGGVCECMCVQV